MQHDLQKQALLTHRPLSLTMGPVIAERNADGEPIAQAIVAEWNPKLSRKVVNASYTLEWGLSW